MVLKQEIVDAFAVLGLTPDVAQSVATTAYKKLALKHHPDRNYGDSSAIARFQEIGRAWTICQRHFDHPSMSHVPEPGARNNYYSGRTYDADDEVPLDEYEAEEFFKFMFGEMLFSRFSYAKGQRYRRQRAGFYGGGVHTFSGGFAESQQVQEENSKRQRREHEEYQQRVRAFEREIAAEQAEIDRHAREVEEKERRLAAEHSRAFQLARSAKGMEMKRVILEYDLDVKKPQKLSSPTQNKRAQKETKAPQNFETMLHAAAASCDSGTVMFLLSQGADPSALNPFFLTPFHVAISHGNTSVVTYFLDLVCNTKTTDPLYGPLSDGCHPSRTAKDGRTPLQLAIGSGNVEMVGLVVRNATVHDVEKCWIHIMTTLDAGKGSRGSNYEDIKNVLLTKKGFSPPDNNVPMSKKAMRKRKLKEEEERAKAEKAQRLAEQEENFRRKQGKRAEDEAMKKREEDEAREKARREEEEKIQRAENEQRACEEAARLLQVQEKARQEAEERARRDAEEKARREMAAAAEKEKRLRVAMEAKQRKQKEADRLRAEQEAKRVEKERLRAEAEAAKMAEQRLQEEARLKPKRDEEHLRAEEARRLTQEMAAQEAKMRRRAEQSARDKARNQQRKREAETLARAAQAKAAETTHVDGVAHQVSPKKPSLGSGGSSNLNHGFSTRHQPASLHSPLPTSAPVPNFSGPPPVPVDTHPKVTLQKHNPHPTMTVPPSPPMTPETLQTCTIPDDLFAHEQRLLMNDQVPPLSSTSKGVSGTESGMSSVRRGRRGGQAAGAIASYDPSKVNHVGNRVQCRYFRRGRCTRGTQCQFSHAEGGSGDKSRSDTHAALEQELAKKEREIEKIRAELAAATTGTATWS